MTATAAQIAKLRRMTAEPGDTTYSDADIQSYIEAYPLVDENGESPRVPSSTSPGEMEANDDWTATYDLHAAAAAIWEEKAATLAQDYDYEADGSSFSRSQAYKKAIGQARYHAARRSPKTITMIPDVAREESNELTN